jgi:hypothetical protein
MNADQLVMEYLAALRVAVTGLPRADDLVADIGARIADVRTSRPDDTPEQVQAFLDSLGNPYEIAANAFRPVPGPPARPPAQRARPPILPPPMLPVLPPAQGSSRATETLALVALTAGALVTPVVGPFVGMVLASCSRRWRTTDKVWAWLLATSSLPILLLALAPALVGAADGVDVVAGTALLAVVLGPMAAGLLLARRIGESPHRHALRDHAYQRAPRPYAHRLYAPRGYGVPPYPPRFDPARFDPARFDPARFDPARFDPAHFGGPPYPPRFLPGHGFRPAQRFEPYPVRSSGRSFPKR